MSKKIGTWRLFEPAKRQSLGQSARQIWVSRRKSNTSPIHFTYFQTAQGERIPCRPRSDREPVPGMPHYVTGTHTRNSTFPNDEEYSRALDCFVKGCADIFLTDSKGNAMLGKRKVELQPDWWFLGGRMKAGDTIEEAAA